MGHMWLVHCHLNSRALHDLSVTFTVLVVNPPDLLPVQSCSTLSQCAEVLSAHKHYAWEPWSPGWLPLPPEQQLESSGSPSLLHLLLPGPSPGEGSGLL